MYSQGISGIVILVNICASVVQTTAKGEKCCVSLHTTQHEKALALRDLFTQLRLAATSSDTFESTRNIQLGKCTVDLTRSDHAKQDYLQQELKRSTSVVAVLERSTRAQACVLWAPWPPK